MENLLNEPQTKETAVSSSGHATIKISGPDINVKITPGYAAMVAQEAYFKFWPMVNIYNKRLGAKATKEVGLTNGILPTAPLNHLSMLHDYVAPEERWVACPNQDVVYGACIAALDESPIIIQVPDFGDRFWVFQAVDLRTDSFVQFGSMYHTKPGFYMLVGPDWTGEAPKEIINVFRSKSATAFIAPRVFQSDSPQDKQIVQSVIAKIDMYPLDEFDGTMRTHDWSKLPSIMSPGADSSKGEVHWVVPEIIFDQLPEVFKDAPALPGEESLYAQVAAVMEAAKKDLSLKKIMIEAAVKAEAELIAPLLQFRNWGIPLPAHWTTIKNGAAFGTDYFTRTAVARSNILVNADMETKYFYQDLDENGQRLNGVHRYTVTFPKGGTPAVNGFWSLTLYDEYHFFVPNEINRYSLGTKNKTLRYNTDGSLTIYVQAEPPFNEQKDNWLPAPKNVDFTLYIRAYWPKEEILNGTWTPPSVVKMK